ncbi:MAG: hypothetical protein ACE5RO_06855, partial [Candidatus Nitrosomaritimum yanchengensis]
MDPKDYNFNFVINATPLKLESEELEKIQDELGIARAETKQFIEDVNSAGFIEFDNYDIRRFKRRGVLPHELTNEESNQILNVATRSAAMGIGAAELEEATNKADLNEKDKNFLINTSDVLSYFEERNPNLTKNLQLV